MAVNLSKGQNVSLEKEVPGLKAIMIGLGWDASSFGTDVDLDAAAFICNDTGKVRNDGDFIYYNHKEGADGAVIHQGDNLTGDGTGDDEQILVNLETMPEDVIKIVVVVTIFRGTDRAQNFGGVENAFIRIVNVDSNTEIARYDLTEDYSTETAMIFGEVYKKNGEWKFKAIGQGSPEGLADIAKKFGVAV